MEYYKGILPIYEKDSVKPMSVQSFGYNSPANTWRYGLGLGHLLVIDFRSETLDPYIKDYVLTLIKLGMQTCYSCDGWHIIRSNRSMMKLVFTDRYSAIWHSLLFDDAVSKIDLGKYPFGLWRIVSNDIRSLYRMLPPTDEGKLEKYLQLKLITDYLHEHSAKYLGKLKRLRNTVNGDYPMIDSMSNEEVRELFARTFEKE